MSKTISIAQWQKYLNKKTGGFKCPICHRTDWQTQQNPDGTVSDVKVLDNAFESELNDSLESAIELFNDTVEGKKTERETKEAWSPSLLKSVNILRCGHCGWIALFDREFVEEEIDD